MQPRLRGKRGARHGLRVRRLRGTGTRLREVLQYGWSVQIVRFPDKPENQDLDGQTLAALGAASVQDGAASAGFHAHAETMGALATGNGRLVGTFHGRSTKRTKVRRDLPGRVPDRAFRKRVSTKHFCNRCKKQLVDGALTGETPGDL